MSHTLIRARAVINIVSMSRENNELGFLEGLADFKHQLKNFMNSSTEEVHQYQDQTIVVVGAILQVALEEDEGQVHTTGPMIGPDQLQQLLGLVLTKLNELRK